MNILLKPSGSLFSLFWIVILINYSLNNLANSQDIKFNHITPDEGFGFGNVWTILEDHEGFMWFGTEDGLVKYNGYDLVNYKNNNSDSTTISTNFTMTLLEDRFNQLWIGTFGGGLNLYDRNTDSFRSFMVDEENPYAIPHNRIKVMTESQDGKIWLGTEGAGVVIFDPNPAVRDAFRFERFDHPKLETNNPDLLMIRSIAEDSRGNIYIGSLAGMTIVDKERKNITQLQKGNEFPGILSSNIILEIFIDSQERVWIGTLDAGVDLYLPEQKKVINYAPSKQIFTLNHPEIETITEDRNGTLWFGSDNGLSRLDQSNQSVPENKFKNFYHESLNENSLLSNAVKIVFIDSENALWAGTYYGGINVYNPSLYKFIAIRNKPWVKNSLVHNNVTAFEEDKMGNLWIGTDGGGISILKNALNDIYTDNYTNIKIQSAKDRLPETKAKTMKFDHDGNLWIGYWVGGLYKYNPANGRTEYYGPNDETSSGLLGIRVLDIDVDQANNLWVGTFDQGVAFYDRSSGKFKNYLASKNGEGSVQGERFNSVLIDSKNRIWAGGDLGGLNLYDKKEDAFIRIVAGNILNKNISILSLMEKSNGEICIGTVASGLIIYNPETQAIKNYSEASGMPNNVIHAIYGDDSENLWMSTNLGLAVLDEKTGNITNYTRIDGLQGNQFNNGACYKMSNGLMLMGGTNGWNAFHPESISKSQKVDKIVYTNLWVNGKLVRLNDPNSFLHSDLNSGAPIKLEHTQKSFTVEFSILDYDFSQVNQYAYFLEGFDSEWQNNGHDRKAVFTNLSPGKYKLRIKATNHDGFWIEKPEVLEVNIIPAWWQTPAFRIVALLLVVSLVYLIYRIRINFLVKQSKKLENIVGNRTSELKSINLQLYEKNNEIQAQNEELFAQNEQINMQRGELEKTQLELRNINEKLEDIVTQRTSKLESTIKQLDKTVLELDRFVYSASHDLSAPLKSVKGLIDIIRLEKDPVRVQDCIKHMIKSVESLEDVIQSLVDYSRNTHMEIEKSTINCHQFLTQVVDELHYLPGAEKIRFENELSPSVTVQSDANRLKIILHNLIGNTIKYADFDKKDRFVKFLYNLNNKHWELKIVDNGIGIDREHLSKIFDMYFRASENSKGSGLGLFIVRESMNKLNGTIKVESIKGEGTTFTMQFPT